MLSSIEKIIYSKNAKKLMMGISMIILNIGSKYIDIGLTKHQEVSLKKTLGRELLIFVLSFTATHDIAMSILLTAAFTILASYLLNHESSFCIIPHHFEKISREIDYNKDGIVTTDEEKEAINILKRANYQKLQN
tara:strand:- start:106 stop:510 length:405 start_codon:yes stop_codon:yes gene_type:complete